MQLPTPVPTLRSAMADLLGTSSDLCARDPSLRELGQVVDEQRASLNRPMRVAFVGRLNAGKSTMLNAFLGENLAPTGNGELTYNVSWIKYGETKEILAHLIDGTTTSVPVGSLDQLTRRDSNDPLLHRIRYLEFHHPNPMLKSFDLIDTPGLHSFWEKDSRNTQKLLTDPETRPHAIVLLFAETLRKEDNDELEKFHRSAGSMMSGLTAIGALTKVDIYEKGGKAALEEGRRVIAQIEETHPMARGNFFAILPVVGQTAYGAQILESADFATLEAVARLPKDVLSRLMRRELFAGREYPDDPTMPPLSARRILWEKLDAYGIDRALRGLGEGHSHADVQRYVYEETGVGKLRELVISHFGNRAYLIKSRTALGALKAKSLAVAQCVTGAASGVALKVGALVERIFLNEPRFKEFELLEKHYSGRVSFNPNELDDLLLLTGERGGSCANRLGLTESASPQEMLDVAQARAGYWKAIVNNPCEPEHRRASATILADSFFHIRNRVRDAVEHRKVAEELLAYEL